MAPSVPLKEKPAESRKDESKGEAHGEEAEKKLGAHSEPSSEDKEKSSEQQAIKTARESKNITDLCFRRVCVESVSKHDWSVSNRHLYILKHIVCMVKAYRVHRKVYRVYVETHRVPLQACRGSNPKVVDRHFRTVYRRTDIVDRHPKDNTNTKKIRISNHDLPLT